MDGQTGQEIVKMVLDFLREIGNALIDTGFTLAMKRVYFLGIKSIIIAVALIIFSIILFRAGKKWWSMSKEAPHSDREFYEMGAVFSILISVLVWLPIIFNIINALDYLLNPEWNAILLIINLVQ